jgi:hypothetical protein
MAGDCSTSNGLFGSPNGIYPNSIEDLGIFFACVHDDHQMIVYAPIQPEAEVPSFGLPYAVALDSSTRQGTFLYRLVNIKDSPLWQWKADSSKLFAGSLVTMDGGPQGLEYFHSSTGSLDANPPWAWYGGPGERKYWLGMGPFCWYTFSNDNTDATDDCQSWPRSVAGRLLTNPPAEIRLRFPWLPDLDAPVRYNAFVPPANDYNTPPLAVDLLGPDMVPPGQPRSWTASATGGVPPLRYQWSGALTGTSGSVQGSLSTPGYLYLDVWDAVGQHFASSLYVDVVASCAPRQLICP